MSLLPSAGDLEHAGEALANEAEQRAATLITEQILPKLKTTLQDALDGLHVEIKVTLDITRKAPPVPGESA